MANTYTQIHIQFVFAVQNRYSLIREEIRQRTEKYITGIVQSFGHKMLSVFCMPDHTHLLVGFRNNQTIADLMREVKAGSSKFLNSEKLIKGKFNWQNGYGAFSYSKSEVPRITDYILNQPQHHKKTCLKKNIWRYSRSLIFNMMNSIYLIGFDRCDPYRATLLSRTIIFYLGLAPTEHCQTK